MERHRKRRQSRIPNSPLEDRIEGIGRKFENFIDRMMKGKNKTVNDNLSKIEEYLEEPENKTTTK